MKNLFLLVLLCLAGVISAHGQAKKPTLMVVPSTPWCSENGYLMTFDDQGKMTQIPDYEKALNNEMDLNLVIAKISELMAERNFPLKDMASTIKNISTRSAEDVMTASSTSGATLAESPLDQLYNRAKADIILELGWKVNKTGPKQSVTYILQGKDAYTGKNVATASGTGAPSFSAEVPVLLEEAVLEHMDAFQSQLQAHFDDMAENGREVSLDIRVFDNGSGVNLESEFGGEELTDIIDNWMAENTVKHRYSLSDATENVMRFEQVRIPLYRANGSAMDTRAFATTLRKFLSGSPYNLTSKIQTKGLGYVQLIIGEK